MASARDIDWSERVEKWAWGIDPSTASKEDIREYIATKTYHYVQSRINDTTLWDVYQEDFKDFEPRHFQVPRGELNALRASLRCGGVYVPAGSKNYPVAQVLVDVAQEEEQHQWSQDDVKACISDLRNGPLTSVMVFFHDLDSESPVLSFSRKGVTTDSSVAATPTPTPQTPRESSNLLRPMAPTPPVQPSIPPVRTENPPVQTVQTTNPLPYARFSSVEANNAVFNSMPSIATNTTAVGQTIGAKLISEVAKQYTDDEKFTGTSGGSFDYKLGIFLDICQRVELPRESVMRAFPTMLKGLALQYFHNNRLAHQSFETACTNIRNFFEGPGFYRRNLDKWESINLSSIAAENPDKSTLELVQLMITTLTQLQYGLEDDFRSQRTLYNKIIRSCQGSPACRYAISAPASTLGELINNLYSSIINYEKEQNDSSTAYFTDRRFHSNTGARSQSRGNRRFNRPINSSRSRSATGGNPNTCYVCKKPDCRSWNHTPEEQEESKRQFRERNQYRFKANTPGFDKKFDRAYRQYLSIVEGEGDDDLDALGDAFGALMTESIDDDDDEFNELAPATTTAFFTSVDSSFTHSNPYSSDLVESLNNQALTHQLTTQTPTIATDTDEIDVFTTANGLTVNKPSSRYDTRQFYGIVIDTGAAKYSTAGHDQFLALQRTDDTVVLHESNKGEVRIQFGIGSTSSVGSIDVRTPIGHIRFHVMPARIPFLLSLADMDRLGVYLDNLKNCLVTTAGGVQAHIPVVRRFGHIFLVWNTSLQSFIQESFSYNPCFLTEAELRRLHRRFGHPSANRLYKVLQRSGHQTDLDTLDTLEYLSKYCAHCQKHGQSPGRFKFNLKDDVQFNYSIVVDVFYIGGKPILHIVDEATRYQAGRWLQNVTAKHTWDALRACWIDTYLGPPDVITTDSGKNFASREFSQYANLMGTAVKIVPVEAHNSIGVVERYHAPIKRAYSIITAEIRDIEKDIALQMAFKAINDSVGPDGLVPTLLVYGAYPRMVEYDPPSPTVTQRATAIRKAMAEVQRMRAKRLVNDALNTRNGPGTMLIHDLTLNSDVLVFREGNTNQ